MTSRLVGSGRFLALALTLALSGCDALLTEPASVVGASGIDVQFALSPAEWDEMRPVLDLVTNVRVRIDQDDFWVSDTVVPVRRKGDTFDARLVLTGYDQERDLRLRVRLGVGGIELFGDELYLRARSPMPQAIRINPVPIVSHMVTPASVAPFDALGSQLPLSASIRFQNGWVIPGARIDWSSSDYGVAEVIDGGILVARGVGFARIIATHAHILRMFDVRVRQVPTRLTGLAPVDTVVGVGARFPLRPFGEDRTGYPLVPGASVNYTITGPVAVDTLGVLTALGSGPATVTAVLGQQRHTATITVTP